jgi:hypothetical protein
MLRATGSTELPPHVRGILLAAMSKKGRIIQERRADGVRYRLDFGQRKGRRIRLDSLPGPDGSRISLDESTAAVTLIAIRAELATGATLEQVLARYTAKGWTENTVDARLGEYLAGYRQRVAQGRRSPNTIRELERYGDRYYSWWSGRPMDAITTRTVEEFTLWLGEQRSRRRAGARLNAKTVKNVRDHFRAFCRWSNRSGYLATVPHFEAIELEPYVPDTMTVDELGRVLAEIAWDRRGFFLAAASEHLRLSELRAFTVDDYRDGSLFIGKAVQGPRVGARVRTTKNRTAEWRKLWNPELVRWIEWRLQHESAATALFWNPKALDKSKAWAPDPAEREWHRACERAGARRIKLSEATRHSTLTALGEVLPERALRARSRHRDAKSTDHYVRLRPDLETTREVLAPLTNGETRPQKPSLERGSELEADTAAEEVQHQQDLTELLAAISWRGGRDSNPQLPT